MVLKVHWAQRVRFTIGQWRSWDFVQGQEFSCAFALAQIERLVTRSWMKLISEMLVPSHHLSREKEDTPCWWSHREPRMMVHVSMPFHGQCLPCGTPPFYLIVWVLLVLPGLTFRFHHLGKIGRSRFFAVEECGWNCWSYEDFTTKKTKTWCWQELIFLLFQQRDAGKDPCVFNPAPAETSHITCSIWSDLAVLRFALRSASREIVYKDLDELISTTWDLSKSVDETLA